MKEPEKIHIYITAEIPVSLERKTSVFLSRETGISGNFVGRIQDAKGPFDLQFLTWDFS